MCIRDRFPTVEALANADVADIEAIVRPCGLGKSKARDISACMKTVHLSILLQNQDLRLFLDCLLYTSPFLTVQ